MAAKPRILVLPRLAVSNIPTSQNVMRLSKIFSGQNPSTSLAKYENDSFPISVLAACNKKIAAKAPAETHPIHASHLGVPKSKAENETRPQPAASATWIATADPPPNNTWVNTAMGSASKRASEPKTPRGDRDRKSTRLNSSHANISYAVFCLK